jgi:DNA-binding winged helix-turn-helix (wHTH) protein
MDALAAADISLFEGFRLDRRGGVLFRRDQQDVFTPIAIGRRALDILGVLVERPGDLVSRDEIIDARLAGNDGRRQQPQRPDRRIAAHPR